MKSRKMTSVNKEVGYHPMGAPICLHKKSTWENSTRTLHNTVLRHSVVGMMALGWIKCWKAGHSGSVPRMLTHLQEE